MSPPSTPLPVDTDLGPCPASSHKQRPENPLCFSTFRKWLAVVVIAAGSLCVACASSVAAFTELKMAEEFRVSREPTILTISLFVLGLGLGPLVTGPFSEVYGRAIIYRVSYYPIAVMLVFRFLLGTAGASFLSVAGGSIADMFSGSQVATPMAIYTISPVRLLGPLIGGFINQNLYWRWTYRIMLIWTGAEMLAIFLFVPESYAPVLLKRKAARLRKETGDQTYWAPLDRHDTSLARSLLLSCYVPFSTFTSLVYRFPLTCSTPTQELLIFDRMALLLDIWNALLLGILYLMFQAFPLIFENGHHFNVQTTGLSFLGIGVGMVAGLATQPFWNRTAARHGGKAPPETLLIMGQVGGILVPISLYWFAFTTYPRVHWIVPILASVPFGTGMFFVFTATFTYLVSAYRPIAATMYTRLGTVGATALLAGLATLMAPLPFIFYRIGPRLRANSKFAV
ncbi:MFS general substrate transporter [Mycena olivaceomarginata]|nr:MFS general substrate transporter [Mycena olivaceomarginata]